jgi:hypothetical protein
MRTMYEDQNRAVASRAREAGRFADADVAEDGGSPSTGPVPFVPIERLNAILAITQQP